jgi:hypothetical protein
MQTTTPVPVPFIDNPHAPEVFAAEAIGFLLHQGNVHITLTSPRSDHGTQPPTANNVVIGRLVMPLVGAQRFVMGLYDFLKTRGFDPTGARPVQ